jgi:hypothetical protein
MPLISQLMRGDPKLEACLVSDPAHIVQGARGPHVRKVQQALMLLSVADIASDEIDRETYGPSTASAVLTFKTARRIINTAYQTRPDAIVGKMTIAALDRELAEFEKRQPVPPSPTPPNPIVEPKSRTFGIRVAVRGRGFIASEPIEGVFDISLVSFNMPLQYCFQVKDLENNLDALYVLHVPGFGIGERSFPIASANYSRPFRRFKLPEPLGLSELDCKAAYITQIFKNGNEPADFKTRVSLTFFGRNVDVPMFVQIAFPLQTPGGSGRADFGDFRFEQAGFDV